MSERLIGFSATGGHRMVIVTGQAILQVRALLIYQDEQTRVRREEWKWITPAAVADDSDDDGLESWRAQVMPELDPLIDPDQPAPTVEELKQIFGYDFTDPAKVEERRQQYLAAYRARITPNIPSTPPVPPEGGLPDIGN